MLMSTLMANFSVDVVADVKDANNNDADCDNNDNVDFDVDFKKFKIFKFKTQKYCSKHFMVHFIKPMPWCCRFPKSFGDYLQLCYLYIHICAFVLSKV